MITDDAHNFLKCTDCQRELADVVVTKASSEISMNYIAICPFCNSQSDEKKILGFVHIGSVPGTLLKTFNSSHGKVVILLSKEKQTNLNQGG